MDGFQSGLDTTQQGMGMTQLYGRAGKAGDWKSERSLKTLHAYTGCLHSQESF